MPVGCIAAVTYSSSAFIGLFVVTEHRGQESAVASGNTP